MHRQSGLKRRLIDVEAKMAFVRGLKAGLALEAAAAGAGFSLFGFYGARRRDAAFRGDWEDALELSAYRERLREPRARSGRPSSLLRPGDGAEIACNNRRLLQRRRMRNLRFGAARQRVFLSHFMGTCDAFAAAEAAGVDISTVYKHRRRDERFAGEFGAALAEGYRALETELLRQRLAEQSAAREKLLPGGEMARDFGRAMTLLARYDRKSGTPALRQVSHGRQACWSFEESMALLDKKLRALGALHGVTPPEARPAPPEGASASGAA